MYMDADRKFLFTTIKPFLLISQLEIGDFNTVSRLKYNRDFGVGWDMIAFL